MASACAKCGSTPAETNGPLVPLRGQDVCLPCCNDDAGYWRERALRAEERLSGHGIASVSVLPVDEEADEMVSRWIRERKTK